MKIYLDTNFFIRYVESRDLQLVTFIDAAELNAWQLVTSELTLAETLVLPIRLKDQALVEVYESLLVSDGNITVVPVDRALLRVTAEVRAFIGNQPADAIHIATAIVTSCQTFLSSDGRLRLPESIQRISLESAAEIEGS